MTADQPMEFLRQLDLVSPDTLDLPIHLIGCGGIGSFTALVLSKMGVQHLHLYDPDGIEEHNLPNQLFRLRDVGRSKVEALQEILQEFADIVIANKREWPLKTNSILCCFCFSLGSIWIRNLS